MKGNETVAGAHKINLHPLFSLLLEDNFSSFPSYLVDLRGERKKREGKEG